MAKLVDIEGIGEVYAQKLQAAGLTTIEKLLEKGASPKGRQEIAEQKLENSGLKQRNLALEAEVRDLKEGYEALEERARAELGMVRRGETLYQIIERPDGAR